MATKNKVIRDCTLEYLDTIDVYNPPTPSMIEEDILTRVNIEFDVHNANSATKWRLMDALIPAQIAEIMLKLYNIVNISCAGENSSYDILAIYQEDGDNKGIYVSEEKAFTLIAQSFNFSMTKKDVDEVIRLIKDRAPRKCCNTDKDLIAVNNGIFDYKTKELLPFDPEFVFTAKSSVNYNPYATNVVIHNPDDGTDWDVESWIAEIANDTEIEQLIWQILGAIIRPNVSWNKSAWFYSESGNNGKGTLCELMKQLVGKGAYASIPLSDFGKDFMLEPLLRALSIIVDENDVGTYIDKAANLKAIITGDTIQINRKFKVPIAYQFHGFMVQCLNELPRIKDKSDSFYRRQLFIPFTKCFTGKERKYIKDEYLHNEDVLEYVLYKVLNSNYYELIEPAACKDALDEYKEYNDPVRQFCADVLPEAKWDLLPFKFLYDVYKEWFKENSPSGSLQGSYTFVKDLKIAIANNDEWTVGPGQKNQVYTNNLMENDEPLAYKYNLTNWQKFDRNTRYSGIVRATPANSNIPIVIPNDNVPTTE